jgi:hypothetical protein
LNVIRPNEPWHHFRVSEDVVLPGDLALRKAIKAAYRLDHLPTQQEVLAIAESWLPYRSLATRSAMTSTSPADQPIAGTGGPARQPLSTWLSRPVSGGRRPSTISVTIWLDLRDPTTTTSPC